MDNEELWEEFAEITQELRGFYEDDQPISGGDAQWHNESGKRLDELAVILFGCEPNVELTVEDAEKALTDRKVAEHYGFSLNQFYDELTDEHRAELRAEHLGSFLR